MVGVRLMVASTSIQLDTPKLETTVRFYTDLFGLELDRFGGGQASLKGVGRQVHLLKRSGARRRSRSMALARYQWRLAASALDAGAAYDTFGQNLPGPGPQRLF